MEKTKKEKILNVINMFIYLFIFFALCIIATIIIFFMDYNEYAGKVVKITQLIIVIIGVIQLIFKKINFKYMYGRAWGLIFIFSSTFLNGAFGMYEINEVITFVYEDNRSEIQEVKNELVLTGFDTDSIMTMYEFKKFENVERDFESEKIENITYYYDDQYSKESIESIHKAISNTHSNINKLLKLDKEKEAEIVIVKDLSIIESISPGVIAFVNPLTNKIYFTNNYEYKNGIYDEGLIEYEGTAVHEYTHKLTIDKINQYSLKPEMLPPWFYEGLAVYSEYNYKNEIIPKKTTNDGDIKDSKNFIAPRSFSYYRKSAILVNCIIDTYGEDVIVRILDDMSKGNNIYKSIENVTGTTFDDIERKIYN